MRPRLLAVVAITSALLEISPNCWSQAAVQPAPVPAPAATQTQASSGITPINQGADPLLDLPPLPKTTVSLIGGTIARLDPIRDELVLRVFGGHDVKIQFDVRTQILREERPVSTRELRAGTRVYADTILKDGRVFAKTLRIATQQSLGEATGQITSYNASNGTLCVRDSLSAAPLVVRVGPQTTIQTGDRATDLSQLTSGSLVRIWFRSGVEQRDARKIEILAQPGETFSFAGKITFVDFRAGYVAISEPSGTRTHEIAITHLPSDVKLQLKEGADVVVRARFDGKNYEAHTIEIEPAER